MTTSSLAKPSPVDFSFLDSADFKPKYAVQGDSTKVCFYVGGIQCAKCIRKLEGLVGTVPGLRQLRVEMGKNLVHVEVDPERLKFSQIADAITQLGYAPIPLAREQDAEEAQRLERRTALIRLAVAGACAGNIMTFSFATYFGADAVVFGWLSLLFYLPVVTYVAFPFYAGAWRSMKSRRISIDLPMAIASSAGFIVSLTGLMRGRAQYIYFDSISGFLFLILVARWIQSRVQERFLVPGELMADLNLDRMRVLQGGSWSWKPASQVTVRDRFKLFCRECVPCDAQLESPYAQFNLAWITGEAKPKVFFRGAVVPAGSHLISSDAELAVSVPLPLTEFGKILEQVQKFSLSRNRSVMSSDRWAQWLLGTVFVLAGVFLAAYWHVSAEEALRRSLALIVIACPCAMAFGTPMALSVSLKKARRAGLIIRDANVFESAARVKTVFFDKTGTLTETDLFLKSGHAATDFEKSIILGLENISLHPIAFAFRYSFVEYKARAMANLQEIPGQGVRGLFDGKLYELRRRARDGEGISCALFEDGRQINEFEFESVLKPGCKQTLDALRADGYRVILLTGDNPASAAELGRRTGFAAGDIFAGLSPKEKEQWVATAGGAMMVGDGVNDSLALMKADIGVATSGGVAAALKGANVYLTEPGLEGITSLFKLSREAAGLIRQNLFISLAYNITGGALALSGMINPFVAAVLMPVSSGFILLGTYLRSRR